jgi:hypothetical protein
MLRQGSHLGGDDREAAPGVAGTRRFDAGVQSEEIGLKGDLVDDAVNLADLPRRFFDLAHRRNRFAHNLAAAIRV